MSLPTDTTVRLSTKLPPEFDKLFKPGIYETPRLTDTLEATRIQPPAKHRLGKSVLRAVGRIKPSEAVALAAVVAIGIDAGILWGTSLVHEVSGDQKRSQATAPQIPGIDKQTPRTKEHAKAPSKNKLVTTPERPKNNSFDPSLTNLKNTANETVVLPKHTGNTPAPLSSQSSSPSPQETKPESITPAPTQKHPTPQPSGSEMTPTPSQTEEPTPTAQDTAPSTEVTPTLENTGTGTATALPATIMANTVTLEP